MEQRRLCVDNGTGWVARHSGARPFRHRCTTTTRLERQPMLDVRPVKQCIKEHCLW